jgi:hypothetical protein
MDAVSLVTKPTMSVPLELGSVMTRMVKAVWYDAAAVVVTFGRLAIRRRRVAKTNRSRCTRLFMLDASIQSPAMRPTVVAGSVVGTVNAIIAPYS